MRGLRERDASGSALGPDWEGGLRPRAHHDCGSLLASRAGSLRTRQLGLAIVRASLAAMGAPLMIADGVRTTVTMGDGTAASFRTTLLTFRNRVEPQRLAEADALSSRRILLGDKWRQPAVSGEALTGTGSDTSRPPTDLESNGAR